MKLFHLRQKKTSITSPSLDGAVQSNIPFLIFTPAASGFHIRAALSLLFNRNPLPFPALSAGEAPWLLEEILPRILGTFAGVCYGLPPPTRRCFPRTSGRT